MKNLLFVIFLLVLSTKSFALTQGATTFVGNVGIGSTSPGAALDVQGTVRALNFYFPKTTSSSTGTIYQNGYPFIHTYSPSNGLTNTFMGSQSGTFSSSTGAEYNTGFGQLTLNKITTGNDETAVGHQSLNAITQGNDNTAVGGETGENLTTGGGNVAVGEAALFTLTQGSYNIAIGDSALYALGSTSSDFTVIGTNAMAGSTGGGNDTAIGFNAGRYIADGVTVNPYPVNSVYIGDNTKALTQYGDTNEIVIGSGVTGNGNNTVSIGTSAITDNYFNGQIHATSLGIGTITSSNSVTISGNLGIGTTFVNGIGENNLTSLGNVGIGTWISNGAILSVFNGNVLFSNVNLSSTNATVTISGANTIYTFNSSGSITFPSNVTANVLVVAGGGGGGDWTGNISGGGGGGGGVITNTNFSVNAGTYSITVGNGGGHAVKGQDSVFSSLDAVGGGAGGVPIGVGGNGGSGGGGSGNFSFSGSCGNSPCSGGTGTASQGSAGGNGDVANSSDGGGGGGAGGVGTNGSGGTGGAGGNGVASSISGSSVTYGGGGGGGGHTSVGVGGTGGGATSLSNSIGPGNNGTANLGGGGGSGYDGTGGPYNGGSGGSGIIIISVPTASLNSPFNVGIGTLIPGQSLDVNGNSRNVGTFEQYYGSDNANGIQSSATTGGDLKILTNSSERMRITNAGNVGIGSTAPGSTLDVQGTLYQIRLIGNVGIGTGVPAVGSTLTIGGKCLGLSGDLYLDASGHVNVCTAGSFPACSSSVAC